MLSHVTDSARHLPSRRPGVVRHVVGVDQLAFLVEPDGGDAAAVARVGPAVHHGVRAGLVEGILQTGVGGDG